MRDRTLVVTDRSNVVGPLWPAPRPVAHDLRGLREAVQAAAADRPARLFLVGGEPLLVRALAALVALAREAGAAAVVLDTNGLLLADARRVASLVASGLAGVRLVLPAADDARYARLTGVADGLARVREALRSLTAAGVATALVHPLASGTEDALPEVVAFAAEQGLAVLLDVRRTPAADVALLELHLTTARATAAAGRVPLLRLPGPLPEAHPAAGLPESAWPERHDAVRHEGPPLLVPYERGDGPPDSVRLAVTWRCDQRCAMCTTCDSLSPDEASVRAALREAAATGAPRLVLTGGEPTLVPWLPALVAEARALGFASVELQTNAVSLATPGRAATLAAAGLDRALVSLHAADAATSDAVTGAPGTHARTVVGLDALLAAGVRVVVNTVVQTGNLGALVPLVRLVADRWARHPGFVALQLHTVHADAVDLARWRPIVPPLSVLGPRLDEALTLCRALGVAVEGPGSTMGVPWCALEGDPRDLLPLDGSPAPPPHRGESDWFASAAACRDCDLRGRCPGPQRGYLALHGEDGLRPKRLRDRPGG